MPWSVTTRSCASVRQAGARPIRASMCQLQSLLSLRIGAVPNLQLRRTSVAHCRMFNL